jgi:hypothetical protein
LRSPASEPLRIAVIKPIVMLANRHRIRAAVCGAREEAHKRQLAGSAARLRAGTRRAGFPTNRLPETNPKGDDRAVPASTG